MMDTGPKKCFIDDWMVADYIAHLKRRLAEANMRIDYLEAQIRKNTGDNDIYIKFIREHRGCYGKIFPEGAIKKYYPWYFDWQGMNEPERVAKGIFIECHGMGEFDVFTPEDVVSVSE